MARLRWDEISEVLAELAEALRGQGYRVPTSSLVEAARLLDSYMALRGVESLDQAEAAWVVHAALSQGKLGLETVAEALARVLAGRGLKERAEALAKEIDEKLEALGARPGGSVRKPRRRGEQARYYIELRKIGAIKPGHRGLRAGSREELRRIAWNLARQGYESIGEAARDRIGYNMDHHLSSLEAGWRPSHRSLRKTSTRRLIDLGEAASRKRDRHTLRSVAEELRNRILEGERVEPEDAYRILNDAGLATPDVMRRLMEQGLKHTATMDPGVVAETARSMEPEDAADLIASALKRMSADDAERLLSRVDPSLLWRVKRSPFKGRQEAMLRALREASNSLRSAIAYASTGDRAWRDMAEYSGSRAMELAGSAGDASVGGYGSETVRSLVSTAIAVVEAVDGGSGELDRALARLGFLEAVRVLRGLYRNATSEEARMLVLSSMERLVVRVASREGPRLLPKWVRSPRGRIEARETIYRMVRSSPDPFVFRSKLRSNLVSLALDVSGSMEPYSSWALAIAGLFARSIDRIVLFSRSATVYLGPHSYRSIAGILLEASFTGRTDIYTALGEAGRGRARRVVVISDLVQTVDSGDPGEQAEALVRSGRRLLFIAPPRHDRELAARLRSLGARVVVVYNPRQAARHVARVFLR